MREGVSMDSSLRTFRVGFLAPMPSELRPLARAASLRPGRLGDLSVQFGTIGAANVVATTSGIGMRAAAAVTERLLDASSISHLIVVGIAGGVGDTVSIGDVIVPEAVIDARNGSEYRPVSLPHTTPRGLLQTSDEFVVGPEQVGRLAARGVIAVDMETASIAAVCVRRQCPWSVVRAISDRAGDTPIEVLGLARADGSPDLVAAARYVLTHPWRVPGLAKLGRDASRAARAAAEAAVQAAAVL
jgi:adenosylhomocysteine nucleosidase